MCLCTDSGADVLLCDGGGDALYPTLAAASAFTTPPVTPCYWAAA